MIVITGATGMLNGRTVDHLLDRVSARDIAVVVRDVTKARRFAEQGIDVRHGDYADPRSLPAAFEGADQLILVSSSDPGADAVSLHRNAIDAAGRAGVGRILYTSHQGASFDNPFQPCCDHATTEDLLADSGVPWTSLRNGFYAHSVDFLTGPWRRTGKMAVPTDGPVSWTDREDAAEAAAVILASGTAYEGPVTLTAGKALTFEDVAAVGSDVTGRTVEFDVVGEADWLEAQAAAGVPEFGAHFVLGMFRGAAGGYFAGVDPVLGTLLGREPTGMRETLAGLAD